MFGAAKAIVLLWLALAGFGLLRAVLDGLGIISAQSLGGSEHSGGAAEFLAMCGLGSIMYWLLFSRERTARAATHYAITDARVLTLVQGRSNRLSWYQPHADSVFLLEGTRGLIAADPDSYRYAKRTSLGALTNVPSAGRVRWMRLTGLDAPVRLLPILRQTAGRGG